QPSPRTHPRAALLYLSELQACAAVPYLAPPWAGLKVFDRLCGQFPGHALPHRLGGNETGCSPVLPRAPRHCGAIAICQANSRTKCTGVLRLAPLSLMMEMHVRIDAARHDDMSCGVDQMLGGGGRQRSGNADREARRARAP